MQLSHPVFTVHSLQNSRVFPAKPVGHFQLHGGFAVLTEAPKDCEAANPIDNMLYKLLTFAKAEQTIDLRRRFVF
jgi:hypothetical protein